MLLLLGMIIAPALQKAAKEYTIEVNDGFYKISDLYKKIYAKKLIDNMEFFSIYKNDGSSFKDEDMLEPEVMLKLGSVKIIYECSGDVKLEGYISINNRIYLISTMQKDYFNALLKPYLNEHQDIEFNFDVNNKNYKLNAKNINSFIIGEIIGEIENSSNPFLKIRVSKIEKKEIINNKPTKPATTTTTTKSDKIESTIKTTSAEHVKPSTTTDSSKNVTHTSDSSHIMDKGGISNKPKIGGGNGCCRCSCRS